MKIIKGLTSDEVSSLQSIHGLNVLTSSSKHRWYNIFIDQFKDPLVLILVLAAFISFFAHESEGKTDAYIILVIITLNAGIGFFQEFRTERTLEALKNMVHPSIRVLRDGVEQVIDTEKLVPGDMVVIGEGDKIPADGVLIESHSVKIEESALTGESLPLEKKEKDEVFMGTSVVKGSGILKVESIGMSTEFGKIASLTTETQKTKSPLQKELERIGVFVMKVTVVICVFLFFIGLWKDYTFLESLLFSVSVAIAAVPEGLPTTVTIALALGASVLARKKSVVKKLSSVETLGAVTTICSDKTGTLTKNEMTVRELYLADRSVYSVSGVGYNFHSGKVSYIGGNDIKEDNEVLRNKAIQICALCNDAKLVEVESHFKILGDPTEGALLTLAAKDNKDYYPFGSPDFQNIFPFDSDRKMMSVVFDDKVLVKGSPDQLIEKCTHWTDGKKKYPMTASKVTQIKQHYYRMAENALRVLALAEKSIKKVPKSEEESESDLVFIGLVGMIDPPREEVQKAVEHCYRAGIRPIVITGDYGITAQAIAQELGIVRNGSADVFDGEQVSNMSDKQLSDILKDRSKAKIFARSMPAQKMRIVEALQAQGEIVAMTGDGVNDAPALKKADIGVAMGITGTEVSKEAATMILMNDSFASIVVAVKEGRRIYQNLKKFIWFIFSCNIAELFVIFVAIIFGLPMPLTAVLILAIDLGTDILPAIALGVDKADRDLMNEPPRDTSRKLMSKKFVHNFILVGSFIGASVMGAFIWKLYDYGWSFGDPVSSLTDAAKSHASTMAFVSLVFVQLVNAFSARSNTQSVFRQNQFNNWFLLLAILTSILMVLVMLYWPVMSGLLKTTPLTSSDWAVVGIVSILPLIFVEGLKFWARQGNVKRRGRKIDSSRSRRAIGGGKKR